MKSHYVLILTFLFLSAGCQSSRMSAQRELNRQLQARAAGARKSLVHYQKGVRALESERLEEAHQYFKRAVQADYRNATAWVALGKTAFDSGDFAEAGEAFHQASKYAPSRSEPHYNLGVLFESIGRFSTAADAYETALALDSDNLHVMENLAKVYLRLKIKPSRTQQLLETASKMEDRPDWQAWMQRKLFQLRKSSEEDTVTQINIK